MPRVLLSSLVCILCLFGCRASLAADGTASLELAQTLPVYAALGTVVVIVLGLLCFAWTLRNRLDRALSRLPAENAVYPAFLAGYTDLPLGLPRGTVRAVLALIIVFGSVVFLAVSMIETPGGTVYRFPDALTGILGAILGFYFGKGSTGEDGITTLSRSAAPPPPTEPAPPAP